MTGPDSGRGHGTPVVYDGEALTVSGIEARLLLPVTPGAVGAGGHRCAAGGPVNPAPGWGASRGRRLSGGCSTA